MASMRNTGPNRLAPLVTPLVITFNEAPNIARCLDRLIWAERIVVIDSGSTDGTLDIIARYPQAEVVYRAFDDFAGQCNFGLTQISSPWVLSLDADYELSPELVAEITALEAPASLVAYEAAFVYCIYGRALRGALYPPRRVLYRRDAGVYRNEGHGHRLSIEGAVGKLSARIRHDDRKPLSRWLTSQQGYARREADFLLASDTGSLRRTDRVRLMAWPAPILVFAYTLFIKGCLLDGWPGWLYVLQRTLAEIMIAIEIVDRRLRT